MVMAPPRDLSKAFVPIITSRKRGRQARADAFVDGVNWVDTGCDAHPQCLTCPFRVCRYDGTGVGTHRGIGSLRAEIRRERVRQLRQQGRSIDEIAELVGRSRRSVFRDLRGE